MSTGIWAAIGAFLTLALGVLKVLSSRKDEKASTREALAEVEYDETVQAMADVDARLAAERLSRNGSTPP